MSQADPIVIVGAARTPMGSFQGDFSALAAHDLGGAAIRAAVERAGIAPVPGFYLALHSMSPHRALAVSRGREQARSDFGETVGALLDSISAFPLIPTPVRAVIQAVRTTVVSVARAVWDFFF